MPVPIGRKLEIQFVPGGTYVDVSSRLREATITRPRPTPDQPAQITTLTVKLDNTPDASGFAPFSPDSPAGANYPNIERDRRVRLTATWSGGASTSVRFHGWSDSWLPDAGDGSIGDATVTLTASCVLSRYARRGLLSDYGEYLVTAGYQNDYWPYDDSADSSSLRGLSGDVTVLPAQVIQPANGTGSMVLGSVDGTIYVDGAATFARGDTNSPSPVILHTLRGTQIQRVSAWVKLDQDPSGGADDVMSAWDKSGNMIWRFTAAIVSGLVEWRLNDTNGTSRTLWNSGYPRDESWHWLSLTFYDNAGDPGSGLAVRDKAVPDRLVAGYFTPWPSDPSLNVAYIVVGGQLNPKRPGKQTNTMAGSISGLWVSYAGSPNYSWSFLSAAGQLFDGATRAGHMVQYGSAVDALTGGGVGSGTADPTSIQLTHANGNLLDAWAEHARTTQGLVFTRPDGKRQWLAPSAVHSTTVALTLDAQEDLHMPAGGWQGERIERPTRVTATSPAGSVTVVDTATETMTGLRLDGTGLATSAGNINVAKNAAAVQLVAGRSRLSSFGIDLTLTQTDKTTAIMALLPGGRVRISGLPSATLGFTYQDVYASGWTESYLGGTDLLSVQWMLDTDPADDPPEAIFDDATYGRFAFGDGAATVTGGTCVGSTGTGTVIITSTSPLTTTGGEYPMDLDWNGERITISGVGGGTSPQTATVTARGVAPSVARVHATGEAVDIWYAARFGA